MMNIVRIAGGLGNQMFQYAFLKALENNTHKPAAADLSIYKPGNTLNGINLVHNGYELEKIFGIKIPLAAVKEVRKLADLPENLFKRAVRKYFRKKTHLIYNNFKYNCDYLCDKGKDMYFEGYWQSPKYFENVKDSLKKDFAFSALDKTNSAFLAKLGSNSLSIHVRRGDYKNQKILSLLDKDYYDKALLYITSKEKITGIAVFSNDIDWCRNNLDFKDIPVFYADHNTGTDSYKDMQLMSLCRHNIIANSSFSWWGAWLNSNPQKTVVCPRYWMTSEYENISKDTTEDLYLQEWITI